MGISWIGQVLLVRRQDFFINGVEKKRIKVGIPIMNPFLTYFIIAFLSFVILSFQILLSIFLINICFLPLLAIPFTFLGSGIAGVFVYIKYFKKNGYNYREELLKYFSFPGISILLYIVVIKCLPLIYHGSKGKLGADNFPHALVIETLIRSIFTGLISVLVFLSLGIVYALIYKYNSKKAPKLYFFDLLGASFGCIFAVFILNLLQLGSVFILLAFLFFIVDFLLSCSSKRSKLLKTKKAIYSLCCFLILLFNIKTGFLEVEIDSNNVMKGIIESGSKGIIGSDSYEEIWRRWNAYSRVSLFINNEEKREENKYLFRVKTGKVRVYPFRADNPYVLKLFEERTPATLGFLLGKPKKILILLAGVGADMIEAYSYSYGTSDITGVELNPLSSKKALDLAGYNLRAFFAKKNVHFVIQEARNYIESTDKKFDSIILSYGGGSEMQYLGLTNPTMSYLYTKEAFKSYLKHLTPNGKIVIVNRDKIKVVAIAKAALEELGYENVVNKIIIIADRFSLHEENTLAHDDCLSVLIKNTDFTKEELDEIQNNLFKMNLAWVYNPYYTHKNFKIFEDLLKSRNVEYFLADLSNRYNKDYSIAKDDRPFLDNAFLVKCFFSADSWHKVLNRYWSNDTKILSGYFSLISLFIFLTLLGLLLIILPLIIKAKSIAVRLNFRILAYFATIGLGFILVELAMMQSFALFLGNPAYAFSIVLLSLLLAAGVGSFLSNYLFERGSISLKTLSLVTFFILFLFYLFIPWLNIHLLRLNLFLRVIIILLIILPIGICLGMFFPQGLKKIYNYEKDLIPLACGLNGYMSIVGSGLGIFLPLVTGFSSLILIAAFLYLSIMVLTFRLRIMD